MISELLNFAGMLLALFILIKDNNDFIDNVDRINKRTSQFKLMLAYCKINDRKSDVFAMFASAAAGGAEGNFGTILNWINGNVPDKWCPEAQFKFQSFFPSIRI